MIIVDILNLILDPRDRFWNTYQRLHNLITDKNTSKLRQSFTSLTSDLLGVGTISYYHLFMGIASSEMLLSAKMETLFDPDGLSSYQ